MGLSRTQYWQVLAVTQIMLMCVEKKQTNKQTNKQTALESWFVACLFLWGSFELLIFAFVSYLLLKEREREEYKLG